MLGTTRLTVSAIALLGTVALANAQPADPHHPANQDGMQTNRPGMPQGQRPMPGGPAARPGGIGMGMGPGGAQTGQGQTGQGQTGQGMTMGGDMAQMMAMMQMMQGSMMGAGMSPGMGLGGFAHIEGQIAFFKAELAITDAQAPQWNAFADALRGQATHMRQVVTPVTGDATAPARMEQQIAMLNARSEAMQAVLEAMKPLYAVLTDDQKKTADTLMAEHFASMRRGAR